MCIESRPERGFLYSILPFAIPKMFHCPHDSRGFKWNCGCLLYALLSQALEQAPRLCLSWVPCNRCALVNLDIYDSDENLISFISMGSVRVGFGLRPMFSFDSQQLAQSLAQRFDLRQIQLGSLIFTSRTCPAIFTKATVISLSLSLLI